MPQPLRFVVGVLGTSFVLGGLKVWWTAATALVSGTLGFLLVDAGVTLSLALALMPWIGFWMCRSALEGRDLIDEHFNARRRARRELAED